MRATLSRWAQGDRKAPVDVRRFIGALNLLKYPELDQRYYLYRRNLLKPSQAEQPLTIGLAISGGVDSMALATLCSQYQATVGDGRIIRFNAFVVDHGVRDGSRKEADSVATILRKKNIPTTVLNISWPEGLNPKEAPNFESLARTYRFQALGRACRDSGIAALFLAHHQDDQAEGVLMRLALGHKKSGLCGMSLSGDIPECRGIYGVHESGDPHVEPGLMSNKLDTPAELMKKLHLPAPSPSLKSLPGVSKREYLPRQTTREVMWHSMDTEISHRHLSPSESLRSDIEPDWMREMAISDIPDSGEYFPEAFQYGTYLLGVPGYEKMPIERGGVKIYRPLLVYSKEELRDICKAGETPWFEDHTNTDPTLTKRNAIRHIYANHKLPAALQKPSILALARELQKQRSRALTKKRKVWSSRIQVVQFEPRVPFIWVYFQPLDGEFQGIRKYRGNRELLLQVLRDTILKVTSHEHIHLRTLNDVVSLVFPELQHSGSDDQKAPRKAFTVGGVMFDPVRTLGDGERAWIIKPQPYFKGREPRLTFTPVQPGQVDRYQKDPESWKLYDGRHWVHILNLTSDNIYMRPFRSEDINHLNPDFLEELHEKEQEIPYYKEAKVRHLLPAIVADTYGIERVIALPTLNIVARGFENLVKYEVRYRYLPPEGPDLESS